MNEPIREIAPENTAAQIPVETAPMAWHGFLVKLMLPLAAAYHLFQAVWILLGKVYYTVAVRDAVYAGLPVMRILDYALAAMMLAAAVLFLCARGRLGKLQAGGVKPLLLGYGLLALAWLGYGLARYFMAGLSPLNIAVTGQFAGYFALLLVNKTYYARRRNILKADA